MGPTHEKVWRSRIRFIYFFIFFHLVFFFDVDNTVTLRAIVHLQLDRIVR
jgi:hypothetical protein